MRGILKVVGDVVGVMGVLAGFYGFLWFRIATSWQDLGVSLALGIGGLVTFGVRFDLPNRVRLRATESSSDSFEDR